MRAVSRPNLGPSLLKAILSSPHAVVVSELMLERAARYIWEPETIKILLQNACDGPISERILFAAAQNQSAGFEILKMLIILPGVTRICNDDILAILKNDCTDTRVVRLLFEKQNIVPDSDHLLAATYGTGLETLTYLLERCNKDQASFLESLLQSPNQVRWSELAHSVARVLVRYLNEENITQEIWKDVAAMDSKRSMGILLGRIEPANYQDLLDEVAGNQNHGYDLVKYLLSLGKVAISKDTFLAAARNRDFSDYYNEARIFWFLLQHCQPSAWGQEILLVAAKNLRHGRQIIEFMMKNLIRITVNQELLQASARNPRWLEYLLCQPLDGVIDTTEIVKLAANGEFSGMASLPVLVQSGCSVKISEDALKAVCRIESIGYHDLVENGFSPHQDPLATIMDKINLLLEHPSAVITEEVMMESVKNEEYGIQMVQTFMNCPKNRVSMSQAILEVAIQNEKRGYELIKYIFDDYASNVKVTEKLVALASKNLDCKYEILEFLLHCACAQDDLELVEQNIAAMRDDPHGLRNAIFRAAYRGHTAAFEALMQTGTDLTAQLGNVGSVLHVASFAGQLQIVKTLVPYASLLDVPGGQFLSPLLAALMRDRVDIATCLVSAGVSIETVDDMRRIILHRLIRSEKSHQMAALLKLGASTEARDLQGYSALHHAVLASSSSGVTALLDAGVPIDVKDNFGWSALHWAARKGDMKIAELLTRAGADLDSSDSQEKTPLDVAVFFGQDKLQKILWTATTAETLDLKQGLYADGTWCEACRLDIYGDRYKCNTCEDFDLCYRCVVDAALIHDSGHAFGVL